MNVQELFTINIPQTVIPIIKVQAILLFLFQIHNGTLAGGGCDTKVYVPDVFLMSIILFLGTFIISIILKDVKNSLFFPSKVMQFFV